MRGWLKRGVESLEGERQKLCSEDESEQKKKVALKAKMQQLAKAFLVHKGLLQRAAEVHAALAFELHNAGAGLYHIRISEATRLRRRQYDDFCLDKTNTYLSTHSAQSRFSATSDPSPASLSGISNGFC